MRITTLGTTTTKKLKNKLKIRIVFALNICVVTKISGKVPDEILQETFEYTNHKFLHIVELFRLLIFLNSVLIIF